MAQLKMADDGNKYLVLPLVLFGKNSILPSITKINNLKFFILPLFSPLLFFLRNNYSFSRNFLAGLFKTVSNELTQNGLSVNPDKFTQESFDRRFSNNLWHLTKKLVKRMQNFGSSVRSHNPNRAIHVT